MFELPAEFPSELVPLSWLVGAWQGTGVVSFSPPDGVELSTPIDKSALEYEFDQHITFDVEGSSVLRYDSVVTRLDDGSPVTSERGYWRVLRPLEAFDAGPGLVAGVGETTFLSAESVERLRNEQDAFDIEAAIVHPDGIAEFYVGIVKGPRIDLVTDAVLRPESARDYRAASRMWGLVDGHLLWAWDAAALGGPLRSFASARLARA